MLSFKIVVQEIGNLGRISKVPSLLSFRDALFYQWLGKKYYTGQGEVLDVGCWLGSSTLHLYKGLSQNPHFNNRKIFAFDWFKWDDNYNQFLNLDTHLSSGDDFMDLTGEFLGGNKEHIELIKIDYSRPPCNAYWPLKRPIEIFIVDAAKSPALLINILKG